MSKSAPKSLVLVVKELGHVPSFKNTKAIAFNRRTRKRFIRTDPKKKDWMERCIRNFEFQLSSAFPTGGAGTVMEPPARSSIASSLPLDDSLAWIPELHVVCERVAPGEEGAAIIIEMMEREI